jgi:hypothetical protein
MKLPLRLFIENDVCLLLDADGDEIASSDDSSFTAAEDEDHFKEIVRCVNILSEGEL